MFIYMMLIVFYDVTDLCVYAKCTQLKGETPCVGSVAGLILWMAGWLFKFMYFLFADSSAAVILH